LLHIKCEKSANYLLRAKSADFYATIAFLLSVRKAGGVTSNFQGTDEGGHEASMIITNLVRRFSIVARQVISKRRLNLLCSVFWRPTLVFRDATTTVFQEPRMSSV
jgi:hypothetical protein